MEVTQISRTIATLLKLNEDLAEAIALGHDLGHTPFGHIGERVLNNLYSGEFNHNEQSLRIVDHLERGIGLNLSFEVRDGILKHAKRGHGLFPDNKNLLPITLEGQIVRIADTVAYVNHDIDDAIRYGILKKENLPKEQIEFLGKNHSKRINNIVSDIVNSSMDKNEIRLSANYTNHIEILRNFLYEKVYTNKRLIKDKKYAEKVMIFLFNHYMDNPQVIEGKFDNKLYGNDETERKIVDYIAGMTDNFIINQYKEFKKNKKKENDTD